MFFDKGSTSFQTQGRAVAGVRPSHLLDLPFLPGRARAKCRAPPHCSAATGPGAGQWPEESGYFLERDAPWGVSSMPADVTTALARRHRRPPTGYGFWEEIAAAETPHGASLSRNFIPPPPSSLPPLSGRRPVAALQWGVKSRERR